MSNPCNENLELFASCLSGLEAPLAEELKRLGIKRVRPLGGGVAFFCDVRHALSACLWSRLASRILVVVGRVNAGDANLLYEGVRRLPWEDVIAPGASMAVTAHGMNEELRNTRFTALKVKDGVCDRLREARGERPDVDAASADATVDVRIREGRATISLDLSGESLYHRTYLTPDDGPDAPLSCALSAGLLALSGWRQRGSRGEACVDPACGDGFLVVEAAAAACDLAPGLTRERWGFFGWAQSEPEAWNELIDDADERFERGLTSAVAPGAAEGPASAPPDPLYVRFAGASTSSPAIARARTHAKRAGLRQAVSIELADAQNVDGLVERVCAAAGKVRGGEEMACTVASVLLSGERSQSDARAQAEAATFVRAASAAPAGSTFAVAGGDGVEARFGSAPIVRATLGHDRVATEALVFDEPPMEAVTVIVPDSAGGAEHVVEVLEPSSEQFAARLRKTAKERRKWAKREGVSCYRVYDADLPDYAVAIDVYPGAGDAEGNLYLHIAEYAAPSTIDPGKAQRRYDDVLALAPVVLGVRPDHVFSKVRRRDKGGSQYRDSGRRSYVTLVEEDGYRFEVDLAGYLDTGLFLDHRLTRELVGAKAQDKRFLNLFAYTGTASVHAAAGGARTTATVDLSQTYLDWAARNMAANGFEGPEHTFERGDVMAWITEARRTGRRFDLVFVDPPTFSNSKAMGKRTWDVQRDHVELLIGVSRLLSEEGEAVFSCNLRSFKPDEEELAKYGVRIEDITAQTIPHDFERNPRIHKCYLVKRG
ncbi:bifunctional 23S rRNA (guanine(2069)-N(7))-methyltransferase RlmK/23S rRNA (guanine(2445)-N(2))-methyltransferase RlmL [Eggerthella sinensis]|uniref:bifunctional 23S rRNA (guanine(2069)-N(7))-methyltransferase RlmK/23S rRNA (guanine(2445)-N(2))-methyltransferase RlmL n=1 Tax=Eggerthella sinensis TaxID=242230 RepID=UPI001D06883B|nr:bifunctional 23S rRNA (guanine(2069)-N(7))-methyltransferase RlmK/23S rRNA (guanine(2445)-N(2))-methyltransferase RlmL [Eggerthella sinensis]MCB7037253.1 bifunctional 23S rRNA (guanine(2069)-N(7))-methyltransferase RlmK/23S rRNA (guanine(2445)-N(2))-methyltransferase RlmL [Eggerthella sinensis]